MGDKMLHDEHYFMGDGKELVNDDSVGEEPIEDANDDEDDVEEVDVDEEDD